MNADLLGPPLSFAVFLCGIRIGWRLSRLKPGEIDVPTQGFYRGAPKALSIAAGAFGGAWSAAPLGFSLGKSIPGSSDTSLSPLLPQPLELGGGR